MMNNMENIMKLKELIRISTNIVFYSGIGVAIESGFPDLRDHTKAQEYLWTRKFREEPELCWKFYWEELLNDDIKPNKVHQALVKLEQNGKQINVLTRSIDTLNEEAGLKNVYHYYGSLSTYNCARCGKKYTLEEIKTMSFTPMCECDHVISPYISFINYYNSSLLIDVMKNADLLIVAGASLYDTDDLLTYHSSGPIVVINQDCSKSDKWADFVIHDNIGEIMDTIVRDFKEP